MRFYCVSAEFYDYGKVLACVANKDCKKKPNQQFRRVHGMTAFKIWFAVEFAANQLFARIKSGESDINDVLSFYSDLNGLDCQQDKAA